MKVKLVRLGEQKTRQWKDVEIHDATATVTVDGVEKTTRVSVFGQKAWEAFTSGQELEGEYKTFSDGNKVLNLQLPRTARAGSAGRTFGASRQDPNFHLHQAMIMSQNAMSHAVALVVAKLIDVKDLTASHRKIFDAMWQVSHEYGKQPIEEKAG